MASPLCRVKPVQPPCIKPWLLSQCIFYHNLPYSSTAFWNILNILQFTPLCIFSKKLKHKKTTYAAFAVSVVFIYTCTIIQFFLFAKIAIAQKPKKNKNPIFIEYSSLQNGIYSTVTLVATSKFVCSSIALSIITLSPILALVSQSFASQN